jgi:hypothetical protein
LGLRGLQEHPDHKEFKAYKAFKGLSVRKDPLVQQEQMVLQEDLSVQQVPAHTMSRYPMGTSAPSLNGLKHLWAPLAHRDLLDLQEPMERPEKPGLKVYRV